MRNGHQCSECDEAFNTGSQLRNHFGHKHKRFSLNPFSTQQVSGSGSKEYYQQVSGSGE